MVYSTVLTIGSCSSKFYLSLGVNCAKIDQVAVADPIVRRQLKSIRKHSRGCKDSGNMIVKGNNTEVLEALHEPYSNQVKCIYIDPPYNNGEKYNHYRDERCHASWLEEITIVLERLKPLLRQDGSIWISIDDNEVHYLKVAADKVLGRKNFLTTIIWQQRTTRENRKVFSNNHEYLLVYAANPVEFRKVRNLLPPTTEQLCRYKNPDNDLRGPWQSVSANVQAGHAVGSQFYTITSPEGRKHVPPNGRCWVYNSSRMKAEIEAGNIWFGKNGKGVPRIKKFLESAKIGLTPETLWAGKQFGTNDSAKKHFLAMFPGEAVFDTPKPEDLLKQILEIATDEGEMVLDCYLGSGTTAAVAHKLGRQYIGVEQGDHAVEIVAERLDKVIKGEKGGISKHVGWSGGGGFTFYNQS